MKNRRAEFVDEAGSTVVFRDLAPHEVEEMLHRHNVGRLAFAFRDRVDIEPIHLCTLTERCTVARRLAAR